MTIEKLDKANKIVEEIRQLQIELMRIEDIEKRARGGNDLIKLSDNEYSAEFFDLDIKKEIVKIAKNGIQNKIKKLKQEFEEL